MFNYFGNGSHDMYTNMAAEEHMMSRVSREGIPGLRLFTFDEPGIIIGYRQANDVTDDLPVTRRMTPGSHVIVGDNTLGYSFCVPSTSKDVGKIRAHFAGQLAYALNDLGYDAQEDNKASAIKIDGKIVAGHSMSGIGGSTLLHGFLVISPYERKILDSVNFYRSVKGDGNVERRALENIPIISASIPNITKAILRRITDDEYETVIDPPTDNEIAKYRDENWQNNAFPHIKNMERFPQEDPNSRLFERGKYCIWSNISDEDLSRMAS